MIKRKRFFLKSLNNTAQPCKLCVNYFLCIALFFRVYCAKSLFEYDISDRRRISEEAPHKDRKKT